MKNTDKVPTTIKLNRGLYDDFKILGIRHKFTLQSFVEKCIYLYVHEESFKNIINDFNIPILSTTGSL